MKKLNLTFAVFIAFSICSCDLYSVHEKLSPLRLSFSIRDQKQTVRLIDSLNTINSERHCPNPIMKVDNNSIILYLNHCESYLFETGDKEIVLQAFCLNDSYWITKKEQKNDSIMIYVKSRITATLGLR